MQIQTRSYSGQTDEPSRLGEALVELAANPLSRDIQTTRPSTSCSGNLPNGWQRLPPEEYRSLQVRDSWQRLLPKLRSNEWPVYLWGSVGTGKSFLAAQAFCMFKGSAKFDRYCDLISDAIDLEKHGEINRWKAGQSCEITKSSFWRVVETCGLLVIDEIGTGTPSEWRNELFWRLLEGRTNKPLIMTGNINPAELKTQFDLRIQSRIFKGQCCELAGRDQRIEGINGRVHKA